MNQVRRVIHFDKASLRIMKERVPRTFRKAAIFNSIWRRIETFGDDRLPRNYPVQIVIHLQWIVTGKVSFKVSEIEISFYF